MAASAITGAVWPTWVSTRLGPFQDGSGNLWTIAFNSTPNVVAFKSSDAGATWGTTFAGAATLSNASLDCVYDGSNVIYALVQDASNVLHIYSFTINTTTWAEVYSSGTRPTVLTDAASHFPACMAMRSTGEFVIFYQGPLHSSTHKSAYYTRMSSAGVWIATPVEVDPVNATADYSVVSCCLEASDRVRFIWVNSGSAAQTRSVSSTNVLDTQQNPSMGTLTPASYHGNAYYATALGVVIGLSATWIPARSPSGASQAFTNDTNAVGSASSQGVAPAFYYDPVGGRLYCFFREPTSTDLLWNSTTSTTWTTAAAATQDVCTSILGMSVGAVSAGIGVVFNDSGSVLYDVRALVAAAKGGFLRMM